MNPPHNGALLAGLDVMTSAGQRALSGSPPLLRMRGITKSFPGVMALKDVDLALYTGEVLALVGENGAGKSTLIKVLGGAYAPDSGSIEIAGAPVHIRNPVEGRESGVGIVYQEFNLIPHLSARENIFLGREKTRAGFVSHSHERQAVHKLFGQMGVKIDPDTLCADLTVAQQQIVEIAKALSLGARIMVLDEPSATLTPQEVGRLFAMVRELKSQGIGTIYISHRLVEIFQIADRVMVMRDGKHISARSVSDVDRAELIEMMVGRKLGNEFPKKKVAIGPPRLIVEGLTRGRSTRCVSFTVRAGEVLALTGLVGAGRTELVRLIFGADPTESGSVFLDGEALQIRSPRDAIRQGIGLLTEDRKAEGLVLDQSVRENFGLPNLDRFTCGGFISRRQERSALGSFVESLRIKIPHQQQLV